MIAESAAKMVTDCCEPGPMRDAVLRASSSDTVVTCTPTIAAGAGFVAAVAAVWYATIR